MGKITYNDKVKINELTDVPAINKVQDVDMNEIKTSVNTIYDALGTGTDTYSASTSYVVGDMVIYDGMIYECTTATSGAWNSANWSLVPTFVDEKINEKLAPQRSTITARLSANSSYSFSQNYNFAEIGLDDAVNTDTETFTFSNNKITINKAGYYKVSATALCAVSAGISLVLSIQKNDVRIADAMQNSSRAGYCTGLSMTPVLFQLAQNDVISLKLGTSNVTGTTPVNVGGEVFTFLTVEKVK